MSALIALVWGCNLDSDLPGQDAPGQDAPEPACDLQKPFSTPVLIPSVNSTDNEWAGRLSADELTMFIGSERNNPGLAQSLFSATRSDTSSPFEAPSLLMNVNFPDTASGIQSTFPSITGDGLTLFLGSNQGHSSHFDIFVSTRQTLLADFEVPMGVMGINSSVQNDVAPFVLPDGNTLYFGTDRDGSTDIYRSVRSGASFGAPVLVTELNTNDLDSFPVTNAAHITLLFSSDRSDGGARGGLDIWISTRAPGAESFGAPVNAAELNSASEDLPTWLSSDGCTVFLSSNRGSDGLDLYQATRPK